MTDNKLKLKKTQLEIIIAISVALVWLVIVSVKLPATASNHIQGYDKETQYAEDKVVVQTVSTGVTISSIDNICEYWTQRCAKAGIPSVWDIIPSFRYAIPGGGWVDPLSYLRCTYDLNKAITEMTMDINDPTVRGIPEGGGTISTTENQRAYKRGRRFDESINLGILELRQKLLDAKNHN